MYQYQGCQLTILTSSNQVKLFVITQLYAKIFKGDHFNFVSDIEVWRNN